MIGLESIATFFAGLASMFMGLDLVRRSLVGIAALPPGPERTTSATVNTVLTRR